MKAETIKLPDPLAGMRLLARRFRLALVFAVFAFILAFSLFTSDAHAHGAIAEAGHESVELAIDAPQSSCPDTGCEADAAEDATDACTSGCCTMAGCSSCLFASDRPLYGCPTGRLTILSGDQLWHDNVMQLLRRPPRDLA